jgi:hypothetical protein
MNNVFTEINVSILERVRAAYCTLEREVLQAARLHLGDLSLRRLGVIRQRVLSFKQTAEQVRPFSFLRQEQMALIFKACTYL